jgi:hypothetical protein
LDTNQIINALGQVIDTSWGRSSTTGAATQSVKCEIIAAGIVRVRYTTLLSYDTAAALERQRATAREDSLKVVAAYVKFVKASFKELTGETIALKELKTTDGLEMAHMCTNSPVKSAFYRRESFFSF